MSASAAVALRPYNEAPRAVCQDRRGTTNYVSSNVHDDNVLDLRLQRLKLLGIIGQRAKLLSELAWEARHG